MENSLPQSSGGRVGGSTPAHQNWPVRAEGQPRHFSLKPLRLFDREAAKTWSRAPVITHASLRFPMSRN